MDSETITSTGGAQRGYKIVVKELPASAVIAIPLAGQRRNRSCHSLASVQSKTSSTQPRSNKHPIKATRSDVDVMIPGPLDKPRPETSCRKHSSARDSHHEAKRGARSLSRAPKDGSQGPCPREGRSRPLASRPGAATALGTTDGAADAAFCSQGTQQGRDAGREEAEERARQAKPPTDGRAGPARASTAQRPAGHTGNARMRKEKDAAKQRAEAAAQEREHQERQRRAQELQRRLEQQIERQKQQEAAKERARQAAKAKEERIKAERRERHEQYLRQKAEQERLARQQQKQRIMKAELEKRLKEERLRSHHEACERVRALRMLQDRLAHKKRLAEEAERQLQLEQQRRLLLAERQRKSEEIQRKNCGRRKVLEPAINIKGLNYFTGYKNPVPWQD